MKKIAIILCAMLLIMGCLSIPFINPFLGTWSGKVALIKISFTFKPDGTAKITGPLITGEAKYDFSGDLLTLKYTTDSRIKYYQFSFTKDKSQMILKEDLFLTPVTLKKEK